MSEDVELLRRYANDRSEAAFTELVQRHVNLVYSAALRLVGGDVHRAQDVTQQVFSELARQSPRLTRHPALTGWLYTTTRRMALRATRTEQRRQSREQEANTMNEILRETPSDWEQLRPVLEDAMHELGEQDRLAVLLRYFQDKSLNEVGTALGLSENAARMRVDRALDKLRRQLARRGVTSTTTALVLTLTGNVVTAAPPAFVATLASASLVSAATGTGTTLTLLKLMATTKLKAAIISAIVVASVATSLVIQNQTQAKMREADASLKRQADQLARLQAEHERLSNVLRPPANSKEELLRLRNEAAKLRNQAATIQDENHQLQAALSTAQLRTNGLTWQPEGLLVEAHEKISYCAQLGLAMAQYAADHQEQYPTTFEQAATEVVTYTKGLTNFSPDQFEIVYRGSRQLPNYANTIILIRERKPWKTAGGDWVKVYKNATGGTTALSAVDGNFEAYEKQHIIPFDSSKP